MEVHVEVQRRTEALDQGDGADATRGSRSVSAFALLVDSPPAIFSTSFAGYGQASLGIAVPVGADLFQGDDDALGIRDRTDGYALAAWPVDALSSRVS